MVKTLTAADTDPVQQNMRDPIKGIYSVEATGQRIGSAKFFKQ
ncbi:hypothetical protein [Mucilaginibacter sp. SP1R1]|nr:hypothetical protein [Mucilaginibacter sp. SP1R1]MBB6149243.1 hypothetical protein [Mucilaginibacter sp. SP1R1]